ncbi:hypothetical protein HZS_6023 [Henneguya salminicola]|nr:hypothetical protein HZS_6023 [Henneguya salminicola]
MGTTTTRYIRKLEATNLDLTDMPLGLSVTAKIDKKSLAKSQCRWSVGDWGSHNKPEQRLFVNRKHISGNNTLFVLSLQLGLRIAYDAIKLILTHNQGHARKPLKKTWNALKCKILPINLKEL